MALNGLYVGLNEVLERVYRDYGFEEDLDWNDAIVWAADALDLIGAPRAYMPRVTDGSTDLGNSNPIQITNYRGDLPCDFHQHVQLREYNTKIPMIHNSDSFHAGGKPTECGTETSCTNACTTNGVDEVPSTDPADNTNCNPFFNFNQNPTANASIPVSSDVDCWKELSYTINGGKIFTSFKEGSVEMAYWAVPTDEQGLPLIPANKRFVEAVKNYLAHRISFKLDIQGRMPAGKADKLEQEWLFFCASAASAARMPSLDQMESLKNQWLRTIPNINEHSQGFSFLNEEERRNNLNR